eukprot:2698429-Pyramimonas_sp.AAC.1
MDLIAATLGFLLLDAPVGPPLADASINDTSPHAVLKALSPRTAGVRQGPSTGEGDLKLRHARPLAQTRDEIALSGALAACAT